LNTGRDTVLYIAWWTCECRLRCIVAV